jgi:hypothetical protein
MEKTCVYCKRRFAVNPRIYNQQYCSNPECQRVRKRKWQKEKLARESDYRSNQAAAQKEWCSRNKGYWREYRNKNPAYAERNRQQQKDRNRRKGSMHGIAKMDALRAENIITSGRYRLVPLCSDRIAKMDALIVEIDVVSKGCSIEQQGP